MAAGKRVISVRHAMLFYVMKRLNLLNDPEKEDPRRQHIIVVNKDEVRQALALTDTAQARTTKAGQPDASATERRSRRRGPSTRLITRATVSGRTRAEQHLALAPHDRVADSSQHAQSGWPFAQQIQRLAQRAMQTNEQLLLGRLCPLVQRASTPRSQGKGWLFGSLKKNWRPV
jgi:hypothetical protein